MDGFLNNQVLDGGTPIRFLRRATAAALPNLETNLPIKV